MPKREHKLIFIPASEVRTYKFPEELNDDGWEVLSATQVNGVSDTSTGIAVIFSRTIQIKTIIDYSPIMHEMVERDENKLSKQDIRGFVLCLLVILVLVSYTIYILTI